MTEQTALADKIERAEGPSENELPQEIFDRLARCPHYIDIPTAWAIQHSHGDKLEHHPRCSSVPGWDQLSGRGFLCDCSAMEDEWRRIKAMPRSTQAITAAALRAREASQ